MRQRRVGFDSHRSSHSLLTFLTRSGFPRTNDLRQPTSCRVPKCLRRWCQPSRAHRLALAPERRNSGPPPAPANMLRFGCSITFLHFELVLAKQNNGCWGLLAAGLRAATSDILRPRRNRRAVEEWCRVAESGRLAGWATIPA